MSTKNREKNHLAAALIMTGQKQVNFDHIYDGHRLLLGSDNVQLPEATALGCGMTVSRSGGARFSVIAKTEDGDVAVPIAPEDVIGFMGTMTAYLGMCFDSGENFFTLQQKAEGKSAMRDALAIYFDLDFEADKIRERCQKMYAAREAANFEVLERKATERAEKAMQHVIRRLATAASMPEGLEKSVLLEETAPMIRKAYNEG